MSVGLSHLVQSTRAGAMYGLSLALVIILANVFKYPAFRFGSDYPAATGMSLLEGYRRQGKWALIFFGIASSAVAFFGISAISLVVAGCVPNEISHLFRDWDGGFQLMGWVSDPLEFFRRI